MDNSTLGLLSSDVVLAAVLTFSLGLIAWGIPGVILLAWHASRRSKAARSQVATTLDYTYAEAPDSSPDELAALSLPEVEPTNSIRPWILGRQSPMPPEDEKETRQAYLKLVKHYGQPGQAEPTSQAQGDSADEYAERP